MEHDSIFIYTIGINFFSKDSYRNNLEQGALYIAFPI